MDVDRIDLQALSPSMPDLQQLDADAAVPLAGRANNGLAEAVRAHPDRFSYFAALPTADPEAAADQLNARSSDWVSRGDRERPDQWPVSRRRAALPLALLSSGVRCPSPSRYRGSLPLPARVRPRGEGWGEGPPIGRIYFRTDGLPGGGPGWR
jgi:hypothetical protein